VGKSFLLLADNYVAMDNVFQAKGTLQSLIDNFPLQHIKDEAKKKLLEIDNRQVEEQQDAQDTVEIIENNR
jgi:hypothetical protein